MTGSIDDYDTGATEETGHLSRRSSWSDWIAIGVDEEDGVAGVEVLEAWEELAWWRDDC